MARRVSLITVWLTAVQLCLDMVVLALTGMALLGPPAAAQTHRPSALGWIPKLLPPGAKVIETAAVKAGTGKVRSLVLWMVLPDRVLEPKLGGCPGSFDGDHWSGPTRLSLVDTASRSLINTIEIRPPRFGTEQPEDRFNVPFRVAGFTWHVPGPNQAKEGRPVVLYLRDLTGEGVAGQFALFSYVACGISTASVFGYSPKADAAVQYRVELTDSGEGPDLPEEAEDVPDQEVDEHWIENVFHERQSSAGYWDVTWEPGHGVDDTIRDQVQFDPVRQVFVDRRTVKPFPAEPLASDRPRVKR